MNPEKIFLIKKTWSFVITNSAQSGELFYQKLFELDPKLKPLFKGDMKEQARKLISMVTVIVTKLNKLDEILPEIQGLARRHSKYGVNTKQFAVVGQALLWTLEKGLGDKWTKEVNEAWTEVYTILSDAMIKVMNENK